MFGGYPPTAIGYPPTAIGYTPTAIGYPPTAINYPPTAIGYTPTAIGYPPTAIGYPPTAIGYPPTAINYTPTAIGYPPTAIGYPPTAIGYTPTAIGYPPTAIGYPLTAIGYPPTAISYPPAAIIGRIGHSEFLFYFIMATPGVRGDVCSAAVGQCTAHQCALCSCFCRLLCHGRFLGCWFADWIARRRGWEHGRVLVRVGGVESASVGVHCPSSCVAVFASAERGLCGVRPVGCLVCMGPIGGVGSFAPCVCGGGCARAFEYVCGRACAHKVDH